METEAHRTYRIAHPKRVSASWAKWYAKNRTAVCARRRGEHIPIARKRREKRDILRVRRYGIWDEDYRRLLVEQKGVCAICGRPERSKTQKRLSVDHNHKTKRVRGLLCNRCNRSLGYAQDDIRILKAMILYLELHNVSS